jgi:serine/threonine-protein kinase
MTDENHRQVLVKVADRQRFSKVTRSELLRRSRLMLGIQAPELVPLLSVSEEPQGVTIAQEYEGAPTLADILMNEGALPLDRVQSLSIGIARGLHAVRLAAPSLHHGSLSASKVYVTGVHTVRLSDTGLSNGSEALSILNPHAEDMERSFAQDLLPTLSPELVRTGRSELRSDFYALGCLMYQMLTGRPITRGNALATLYYHATQSPTPPSRERSGIPEAWDSFVLSLLAKDPKDRPASTSEVLAALERLPIPRLGRAVSPTSWVCLGGAVVLSFLLVWWLFS